MRIPKKMIEDSTPQINTIQCQTGFSDSVFGGSYIYQYNHMTHIGVRLVKDEGFISLGEVIFNVGDLFAPKTIINTQSARYINGYALSDDNLASCIGGVLIKIESNGLAAAYFSDDLTGKVKSIIIPEQQYLI